jgi:hypothetical protein
LKPFVFPLQNFCASKDSRHNAANPILSRYFGCMLHNLNY